MNLRKKITAMLVVVTLLFSILMTFAFARELKMGDAYMDGRITAADARLILRIAAQLEPDCSQDVLLVSDVNGDDKVTSVDARMVLLVCAKIYDESMFFDKFSSDYIVSQTTREPVSERDSVKWDDIFGTSAPITARVPVTTERPSHPNNIYIPPKTTVTETPGTVPDDNNTPTTAPSQQPSKPTSPSGSDETASGDPAQPPQSDDATSAKTTAGTIIYTGAPVRPTSERTTAEPGVVTTIPPVTVDPNAPALKLVRDEHADAGMMSFQLYAVNVSSVQRGILTLKYDPEVLDYVSFAENEKLGIADARRISMGELCFEFLANRAANGDICIGTVTFRCSADSNASTVLTLSVKDHYSYNWTDSKGRPIAQQPFDSNYYLPAED